LIKICGKGHRILDRVTQEFYIRLEPAGSRTRSFYYIGGFKWQEFGDITLAQGEETKP
jgi:hypothetical protein